MLREDESTNSLPLLDAAAVASGLPGGMQLSSELRGSGYFAATIVEQWRMVARILLEHAREAGDPLGPALILAAHPEPRVRFHSCGLLSSLLLSNPEQALRHLHPLASDPDRRVTEAAQAFGLRPLAQEYGADIVELLAPWVNDESAHARRAMIEACRPRGMWVSQLKWAVEAPALLLPILEPMRHEAHPFPANALGNCLNDISRDKPKLVLDLLSCWKDEHPPGPQFERICKKGIRTLIKKSDPAAMRLCGFGELQVKVSGKIENGSVVFPNSALVFHLQITNHGNAADAKLVYEISTPGKNPERPRRQLFQGNTLRLPAKDTLQVRCRERIYDQKAAKLIAGAGAIRCWLNGIEVADLPFILRRQDG